LPLSVAGQQVNDVAPFGGALECKKMSVLPKILHVEDDADIREIARLALEVIGGLSVHQCESGSDAIAQAEGAAPDLLLLDMTMPDMDGVETLNRLRALPGLTGIPAIFMTARAHMHEHAELIEQGANAVISKPFDAMTLAQEVLTIWDDLK